MINAEKLTLTQEEISVAEKFHTLLEKNMDAHWKWWEWEEDGSCSGRFMSSEYNCQIMDLAKTIPLNCVHVTGDYGMTILHHLAANNFYEAIRILLNRGAKADVRGGEGKGNYADSYKGVTALHIACHSGNAAMVKLLLEYGADSTITDDKGRNCYHFLAGGYMNIRSHDDVNDKVVGVQRMEIAELLEADINQKDAEGLSPLQYLLGKDTGRKSVFLIRHFLQKGADVTVTDKNGNTPLMQASFYNHITAAEALMNVPELINRQNCEGDTALHKAFRGNDSINMAIVYMLIKNGADINIRNNIGEAVADYAEALEENYYTDQVKKVIFRKRVSFEDYFEMLSRFTDNWWGGDYDDYNVFVYSISRDILRKVDTDDDTELVYVKTVLKELLRQGCGLDAISILGEEKYDLCMNICERGEITTIRDICVEYACQDARLIPKLMHLGIDMNEALVNGKTPAFILLNEAGNDSDECARAIIRELGHFSSESMTFLSNEGVSALHMAAAKIKNPMVLEYMLGRGGDLNVSSDAPGENVRGSIWSQVLPGSTPLHMACTYHNVEAVKLLELAGADDTIMNSEEEVPAYCLFKESRFYRNDTACAILRLLGHVDIPKEKTGETPLLHMLRRDRGGSLDMLEIFLDKGVDINKADNKGNTPLLMHADRGCDRDIIKLLLKEGANINARNHEGNSALIFALKHGNCELSRLLIKKGADYNIINEKGETPAGIAIEKGYDIVLELMTDITVFPASDDEIAYDAYEDDFEA